MIDTVEIKNWIKSKSENKIMTDAMVNLETMKYIRFYNDFLFPKLNNTYRSVGMESK